MTVWPNGSKSIPRVTSEYGPRKSIDTDGDGVPNTSSFHAGIDLVGFPNNKAPFAGRVIFARYNGGAGNEVRVQRANGDVARLKHNQRFLVSEGQTVAEAQDVGVVGTTGSSTGVHCHFETWPKGITHINPRIYIAGAQLAGDGGAPITDDTEEEMNTGLVYTRAADKKRVCLIVNTDSGWYHEYITGGDAAYNNSIAAAFRTGSFAAITESHAKVIKAACDKVLASQAVTVSTSGTVALNPDEKALLAKAAAAPTVADIADAVNDEAASRLQG